MNQIALSNCFCQYGFQLLLFLQHTLHIICFNSNHAGGFWCAKNAAQHSITLQQLCRDRAKISYIM